MRHFGRPVAFLVAAFLAVAFVSAQSKKPAKTDSQIRQEIISASVSGHSGSCPCPYNTDRAGRRCGRRSAYSRPGGAAPLCYESDVTSRMVDEYRKRTRE
jgi:hypothetical protein